MDPLIQELERLRQSEGLSVGRFSLRLGLSRPYYYLVKTGQRAFSRRALGKILKAYPQLMPRVMDYVMRE